jgi:hypothetical protein
LHIYINAALAEEKINQWIDQNGAITPGTSYYGELIGCIEDTPTADVETVVRCRDCEAYQPTEGGKPFCVVHERATFSDSFCSEGERREET